MRNIICIECPRGCHIMVDDLLNVTGNSCPKGKVYALAEVSNPTRTLTSTIKIKSKLINRLPVITSSPIPKDKIFEVMDMLNSIEAKAPIKCRDIVLKNVLNLNVDILATRDIDE